MNDYLIDLAIITTFLNIYLVFWVLEKLKEIYYKSLPKLSESLSEKYDKEVKRWTL
jgi:hypothetical protein